MRHWEGFNTHLLCTVYLLLSLDLVKDSSKDLELIALELSFKLSLPWGLLGELFLEGQTPYVFHSLLLPYLFVVSVI